MVSYEQLTRAQQAAVQQIDRMFRVREIMPELAHRATPMVCGPSGSGKSTTLRTAAHVVAARYQHEHPGAAVHVLELNVSSWIINGAHDIPTWQTIQETASELGRYSAPLLILILDELDKLLGSTSSGFGQNVMWHRMAMQEIQELVERRPRVISRSRSGPVAGGWRGASERALEVIRTSWIMAGGAFQDVYSQATPIGFAGAGHTQPDSILGDHMASLHFGGDDLQLFSRLTWLRLPAPTREDLLSAARGMLADDLWHYLPRGTVEEIVSAALETPTPMREVESRLLDAVMALLGDDPLVVNPPVLWAPQDTDVGF